MKHLPLSLILSLFVFAPVWAQQTYTTPYEAQYQVEYSMDSLHPKDRATETVYLYTGSDLGVFMNYNTAHEAQRKADFERQQKIHPTSLTINFTKETNFHKTFYKNLNSGKVKTLQTLSVRNYLYFEPISPKWQIRDSTKTFLNYKVQKATTHFGGRDFVAWFTLAVPIPDGPYLFEGLPGLIVELYDTEKDYVFKLHSIQKLDKPKTWTIPGGKTVTKAKFLELKARAERHVRGDMIKIGGVYVEADKIVMPNGDVLDNPSQIRRMKRKKRAAKNNPLELK